MTGVPIMATPNAHALLSASAAHRWLHCTAAPLFEAQFPSTTSEYAEEGTVAHAVCELYVRKYFTVMNKRTFNAELKKLQARPRYNEEMLTTAQTYLDFLKEKSMAFPALPYVTPEVRVDLGAYIPDGFGTCDCVMIGGDTLQIVDYKHGKGVPVSAENNPQMRLYALGALDMYGAIYGDAIRTVSMAICQPRLFAEPSEETISVEELRAWGEWLKPIAAEAYSGNGKFVPGEHCKFCRGRAQCRARAEQNMVLEDFRDCVPAGKANEALVTAAVLGDVKRPDGGSPLLSDAEIGDLLTRGKTLVAWYDDLKEYALGAILKGGVIPGYKAVEGRSNRAFVDADEAMQIVVEAGYDEAMLYDRKPKSLSELEKFLGKKRFEELLSKEVYKPKGAPTLVPESDRRAAYNSAASDFANAASGFANAVSDAVKAMLDTAESGV